jgi:hypothetical protein
LRGSSRFVHDADETHLSAAAGATRINAIRAECAMDDDDDEQWGGGGVNLRGTDREKVVFDQYSTDFGRFCGSAWRGGDKGERPWRERIK